MDHRQASVPFNHIASNMVRVKITLDNSLWSFPLQPECLGHDNFGSGRDMAEPSLHPKPSVLLRPPVDIEWHAIVSVTTYRSHFRL